MGALGWLITLTSQFLWKQSIREATLKQCNRMQVMSHLFSWRLIPCRGEIWEWAYMVFKSVTLPAGRIWLRGSPSALTVFSYFCLSWGLCVKPDRTLGPVLLLLTNPSPLSICLPLQAAIPSPVYSVPGVSHMLTCPAPQYFDLLFPTFQRESMYQLNISGMRTKIGKALFIYQMRYVFFFSFTDKSVSVYVCPSQLALAVNGL